MTSSIGRKFKYCVLYSLGLRLGKGLRLQVDGLDTVRRQVHIRDSKGNKDRLASLPNATLDVLRRFCSVLRNPVLIFQNRHGSRRQCRETPLDYKNSKGKRHYLFNHKALAQVFRVKPLAAIARASLAFPGETFGLDFL